MFAYVDVFFCKSMSRAIHGKREAGIHFNIFHLLFVDSQKT